jgi:malonate-semialdehyde dehydrogenase (acetylating)/methylmalonate-semialdehyde dehydrogenase
MTTHPYLNLSGRESGSEKVLHHWIGGKAVPAESTAQSLSLVSPWTGYSMAKVPFASPKLVNEAIALAKKAQVEWGETPVKERTRVLFNFRDELRKDWDKLVATISYESGKTLGEGEAGLAKGVEVLEFALAIQNLDLNGKLEVSRGVFCEYRRIPLGVVAGITPFNFPAMVPMWMFPIALALGNAFVWKPSEKVSLTSQLIAECWKRAGLPDGVFTVVLGGKETVETILDHPDIQAVGFVGSTPIAREVYVRGSSHGKRVLALGGAKNHMILLPDADPVLAAQGIRDSFTGCAGQRCMAGSVLLAVGQVDSILQKLEASTREVVPAKNMGAIISKPQLTFLKEAITRAEKEGAKLRVDGRSVQVSEPFTQGNWLGATLLDQVKPGSEAATRELFGPVLSIIRCKDLTEALSIERSTPFGNATSVFTQSGALAEEVARNATSGMIGINIGVPVPREPFSFGGIQDSRFGSGDITGHSALNFWSQLKKITTKWAPARDANWMS